MALPLNSHNHYPPTIEHLFVYKCYYMEVDGQSKVYCNGHVRIIVPHNLCNHCYWVLQGIGPQKKFLNKRDSFKLCVNVKN